MTDQPLPDSPGFENDMDIESELLLPDDTGIERTVARHLALQILYEVDFAGHPLGEVMTNRLGQQKISRKTVDYLSNIVTTVDAKRDLLDRAIQLFAAEWPVDQVAAVDRNIMRIAIAEFMLLDKVGVNIAIDEAMGLAEMFGADSTPRFINGVLGAMADDVPRLEHILNAGAESEADAT